MLLWAFLAVTSGAGSDQVCSGKGAPCDHAELLRKANALQAWAVENGATLDGIRLDVEGDHVVTRLTKAVTPGVPLMHLPYDMCMTADLLVAQAEAFDIGGGDAGGGTAEELRKEKAGLVANAKRLPPAVALMAALLREAYAASTGGASRWAPYLAVLPPLPAAWEKDFDKVSPVPIFSGDNELALALLNGTSAFAPATAMVEEQHTTWRDIVRPLTLSHRSFFDPDLFTLPRWQWAHGIVSSRSFGSSDRSVASSGALRSTAGLSLVPILDSADHLPDPHSRKEQPIISHGRRGRRVNSAFAQPQGELWYNDYGKLSGAQLLLLYGFVLDAADPQPDDRFDFRWEIVPRTKRQATILLRHGLVRPTPAGPADPDGPLVAAFPLHREELDARLVLFLRLHALSKKEAALAKGKAQIGQGGTDTDAERKALAGQPVSMRNEHRACRHLIFSVLQLIKEQMPVLQQEQWLRVADSSAAAREQLAQLSRTSLLALHFRAAQRMLLEANIKLAEQMWKGLLRLATV
jgi:hypothetical protein